VDVCGHKQVFQVAKLFDQYGQTAHVEEDHENRERVREDLQLCGIVVAQSEHLVDDDAFETAVQDERGVVLAKFVN
jgi:hypothetical protein